MMVEKSMTETRQKGERQKKEKEVEEERRRQQGAFPFVALGPHGTRLNPGPEENDEHFLPNARLCDFS